MCAKQVKKPGEVGTTGHNWDGIEELDNPMPRWWLWTFYICIVWALIYTIFFPAWPLVTQATQGIFGETARGNTRLAVAEEIRRFDDANAPMRARLVETDLTAIAADAELDGFARSSGAAVFRTWCAQCHGAGAAGSAGFPNLLDDDWLWGGDIEAIHTTVTHGIRNTEDDDARYSEMPKFGLDGLLDRTQIGDVTEYVLQISGQDHDAARATAGAQIFADNCVSCHGETGHGDRDQGAPNLTDAVWLFGGSRADIAESVTNARFGVMPNWSTRLSEADIRAVTVYVHGLGGGE